MTQAVVKYRLTHCSNGHRYTEENTYWDKRGQRNCRACGKERSRVYQAKRMEKVRQAREAAGLPRTVSRHKTHCVNGHEYTPENTYIRRLTVKGKKHEYWSCRICRRTYAKNRILRALRKSGK